MRQCVLAILLVCAVGRGAHADDEEAGRSFYRQGEAQLKSEHYREAIKAFLAGYKASPRAGFLLNIANCYRKLGSLGDARHYYWRFLDEAPKDHPSRPEALEYLREIQQIAADGVVLEDGGGAGAGQKNAGAVKAATVRDGGARGAGVGTSDALAGGGALATSTPVPTAPRAPAEASTTARLADAHVDTGPGDRASDDGVLHKWWFWTAAVAVVAGGAAVFFVARGGGHASCPATLGCVAE